MDYYGLLFLYYLKGLSGKSILRLFFNIEAGGTEQLLPENTSAPTTTPILADIQYPDGLRTDQYFTYRETPTTVSNKARIKTIKGNTLVWNQLVQNGNFASTSGWQTINTSLSVANNKATITISGNGAVIYNEDIYFQKNHKILVMLKTDNTSACSIRMYSSAWAEVWYRTMNRVGNMQYSFIEPTDNTKIMYLYLNRQVGDVVTVENIQAFDLTQMGLDSITDPSDFTSLFPLPYYAYNQGTLLSFMGNGIKTVGKNLFNGYLENTRTSAGFYIREINTSDQPTSIKLPKGTYTFSIKSNVQGRAQLELFSGGTTNDYLVINPLFTIVVGTTTLTFTVEKDIDHIRLYGNFAGTLSDIQIEFGSTATDYEPYTSSTLSLPISTYFSNGMKSAKTIHDELTSLKAITRIGTCSITDFGNTDSGLSDGGLHWADFAPSLTVAQSLNILTSYGLPTIAGNQAWQSTVPCITSNGVRLRIYCRTTDAKTEFSGMQINYELGTPIETPITTEDANEALSLLMGKSVSSSNANQLINIITKGE